MTNTADFHGAENMDSAESMLAQFDALDGTKSTSIANIPQLRDESMVRSFPKHSTPS